MIEALKMASNWREEDAGNLKVGSHRVRRLKEPHTGGVSWSMEGMERV